MRKISIGIVTFPISTAGNIPTSNLITILYSISKDIYLITGNQGYDYFTEDKRIKVVGVMHKRGSNLLMRIIRYIYTQLLISYKLIKLAKDADVWIFFIGGNTLILPILTAKFSGKKVVLALAGSTFKSSMATNSNLSKPIKLLEDINLVLSDHIILYSQNLITEWNLEKYIRKISIAHEHLLDFNNFKIKKAFNERSRKLIGYLGRLSQEKGVLNFVESVPEILKEKEDLEFLIGGTGAIRDRIDQYLDQNRLSSKVRFLEWIPHDELPKYLNELKLLVLPSYTEGLPNIMLEAMACGTPVLATPVGAIPDIIKDGVTGFILENNNPKEIAQDVIRIIENPNLKRISDNARDFVIEKFSYEVTVENYKNILKDVLG